MKALSGAVRNLNKPQHFKGMTFLRKPMGAGYGYEFKVFDDRELPKKLEKLSQGIFQNSVMRQFTLVCDADLENEINIEYGFNEQRIEQGRKMAAELIKMAREWGKA